MQPLIEFFDGTAFRPHPLNNTAPLRERVAGHRVMYIKIGTSTLRLKVVDVSPTGKKTTALNDVSYAKDEISDIRGTIRDFGERYDCSYSIVSYSVGMTVADIDLDLPESQSEVQEILNSHPRDLLGTFFEEDKRYFPVRHPTEMVGFIFAVPTAALEETILEVEAAGLGVARVGAPLAAGVHLLLSPDYRHHTTAENQILVLQDEEGVLVAKMGRGHLGEIALRSGERFAEPERRAAFVAERISRYEPERVVVGDFALPGGKPIAEWLWELAPETARIEFVNMFENVEDPEMVALIGCDRGTDVEAVDLHLSDQPPRDHLPSKLRPFRMLLPGAAVASIVWLCIAIAHLATGHQELDQAQSAFAQVQGHQRAKQEELRAINQQAVFVQDVGNWLASSLAMEKFLVGMTEEMSPNARIEHLAFELSKGYPQLGVDLTVEGQTALDAENEVDRIYTFLTESGFVNNGESRPRVDDQTLGLKGAYLFPTIENREEF